MTGITCALAGSGSSTLTTVTFTANGTWVAPSSVSSVAVLSGKGAAGVSDTAGVVDNGVYYALQTGSTQPNAAYAQWSSLYSSYTTGLSNISSKTYPGYGPSSFLGSHLIYVDPSDKWSAIGPSSYSLSSTYITGYTTTSNGSPPTSGNIVYSGISAIRGWGITVNGIIRGSAGTASTALGQTFPGGTYTGAYPNAVGNPAVTTTFNNVAVTPGASYSIVVPSGGQVNISYYV